MSAVKENRSTLWFKILTYEGKPIDGSQEQWSLPCGKDNGKPLRFQHQQAYGLDGDNWVALPNITGTWLVSNPRMLYPLNSCRKIYVAKLFAPVTYELRGMVWVTHLQLLREATNRDVKPFGIFRSFKPIYDA